MGINDRDYQRGYYDRSPGFHLGAPRMMTTNLIIFTCLVFFAQLLTGGSGGWVTETFSLNADWFRKPWHAYQLLTYGFLHDPNDLKHIAFNMLGLFFLGRDVEYRYGRREYLAFYLVAIVVAGIVWTLAEIPNPQAGGMLGASGGVVAVVILFALNFPHRTVLFMFFLPMPMWVAALILVGMDAMGAVHRSGNVAFTAHLGGAMFAFLYYQWGWRLERLLPSGALWKRLKPKPKLRVLDPDSADPSTDDRVDEILKKIQEQGRDSLTRGERRILEEASREYQKKRR
jgi:membrane associated rhomboid family serine protease